MSSYKDHYHYSLKDPEGFWMEQAGEIAWFKQPEQGLSVDESGFYRWFKGGKLNTSYLAIDHHVKQGRGDQTAIIYESPVTFTSQTYTYNELLNETAKLAGF